MQFKFEYNCIANKKLKTLLRLKFFEKKKKTDSMIESKCLKYLKKANCQIYYLKYSIEILMGTFWYLFFNCLSFQTNPFVSKENDYLNVFY